MKGGMPTLCNDDVHNAQKAFNKSRSRIIIEENNSKQQL